MSSGVRLAAWIPAIRATASASPLGTLPVRSAATASADRCTVAAAVAVRAVTCLADTSTIRASPAAERCGSPPGDSSEPAGSVISIVLEEPHLDVVAGADLGRLRRQQHQAVRLGQLAEQVRPVAADQLHD